MSTAAVGLDCLHQQYVLPRNEVQYPSRKKASMLFAPLALFAVLIFQVWVRIAFIENGYLLEELRKTALQNDARLRQQRLEYALLTNPSTLIDRAQTSLEMVKLTPQRVRQVYMDRRVGE